MTSGNIKNFELKVGKAGLIILVAGMAALLCTAFLFGIEVGKNIDVYPEKIAAFPQKVLSLVWRPAKIKVAQNQSSNQGNIDLTFYNTLTSKKGVLQDQPVPEKQSAAVLPPAKEEETQNGDFNLETRKQSYEPTIEKIIEKNESRGKEIASSVSSRKQKFTIQAASLKDKIEANKINKKLTSLGFTSKMIKVDVQGKGIFFRVVVPGFENKVQAQEAAQKISQKTGLNCIIKSVDNEEKKN